MLLRACLILAIAAGAAAQDVPSNAYAVVGSDTLVLKKDVAALSKATKLSSARVLNELVRYAVLRQGLTQRGVDVASLVDAGELQDRRSLWLAQGVTAELVSRLDLEGDLAFAAYARGQVEEHEAREVYEEYAWTLFGRIRARVIQAQVNSVRPAAEARKTLEQLAAELGPDVDDATFAARAAKESDGGLDKLDRGDTEWFGARGVSALGSVLPRAIVEACFRKREPGLIETPLEGSGGVYLVRITEVHAPPPFEQLTELESTRVFELTASKSSRTRKLVRRMHEEVPVRYAADAPGRRQ